MIGEERPLPEGERIASTVVGALPNGLVRRGDAGRSVRERPGGPLKGIEAEARAHSVHRITP